MRSIVAAAFVAVLLLAVSRTAGAQVPAGGEFIVNTYTTNDQILSAIAGDDRGNFVIVWDNRQPSVEDVRGQRYDRAGARVGAEFVVNANTSVNATGASVAMAPAGHFVVVWEEALDVFARRYDANGSPAGAVFQVHSYTTGYQTIGRVAIDGRDNLVVTWWDDGRDGDDFGIFARRFGADNSPLGSEFQVNTYTTGRQYLNSLATDAAGNFIIAWTGLIPGGFNAHARIFDPNGAAVGAEFQFGAPGVSAAPAPLYAPDGTILVAFTQGDGSGLGVAGQRLSGTGTPLGSPFQVNTYTTSNQAFSWVDLDSVGNFVVQWSDYAGDGSTWAVKARRFTAADVARSGEFRVNTYTTGTQRGSYFSPAVASDPVGNFTVTWQSPQDGDINGIVAQRYGGIHPQSLGVDTTGNGVLDPGETVSVVPTWFNANGAAQALGGLLTNMTGPAGATYTINDGLASYGTIANNASGACTDCYTVSVSNPPARPSQHWDAAATETLTPDIQGQANRRSLHVGGSFSDLPTSNTFYRFVETLLHHGVTGGCSATQYCPASATTREQMSVFVLVAKEGAGYAPPACGATPTFLDVPASHPFCRWIEELARRGVVSGCGGGNYCPTSEVTREQMAVFVLRTLDPALLPPLCAPPNIFNDVPETSGFCRWIEELANRGVVTGCGGGSYCPTGPVTREQMGVFISGTFGLTLYGP